MLIVYFSLHPNQNIRLKSLHTSHPSTYLSNCLFLWMRFSLLNAASLYHVWVCERVYHFLLLTQISCTYTIHVRECVFAFRMWNWNQSLLSLSWMWTNKTKTKTTECAFLFSSNLQKNHLSLIERTKLKESPSDVLWVSLCVCVDKLNCWIRRSFVQNV